MTLLLPGRFDDNMIQSETIYSSLNLIGLYNDTILDRPRGTVSTLQCGVETVAISYAKNILMVLELTEVLIEMIASKKFVDKDARKKWRVILFIETLKVGCRLLMLKNNGGRMVVPAPPEQIASDLKIKKRAQYAEEARRTLQKHPGARFHDLVEMYINKERGETNPHGTFVAKPGTPASHYR